MARCGAQYVAAFFAPQVKCDGLTVVFNNQSQNASTYLWDFGDTAATADTSRLFSPSYTYPDTGCYVVRLVAQPTSACRDTIFKTICLRNASINANFNIKYQSCDDTVKLKFIDLSTDSLFQIVQWHWDWTGGGVSTQQSPIIIFNGAGDYTINLEVTSANGCKRKLSKQVHIDRFAVEHDKQIDICLGQSVQLNPAWRCSTTVSLDSCKRID